MRWILDACTLIYLVKAKIFKTFMQVVSNPVVIDSSVFQEVIIEGKEHQYLDAFEAELLLNEYHIPVISINVGGPAETIIHNNTVKDGNYGIAISLDSARSMVTNNTVMHVKNYGISILSPDCTVENNVITGGLTPIGACYSTTTITIVDFKGISIYSDDCHIVNNTVINNNGYGIWVTGKGNTIYGNAIAGNSLGNGYSNGEDNQWDDGIDTGNYWGDWSGVGVYNVPGDEGCVDRFPNGTTSSLISLTTAILMLSAGCSLIIIGLVIVRIVKVKTQNK